MQLTGSTHRIRVKSRSELRGLVSSLDITATVADLASGTVTIRSVQTSITTDDPTGSAADAIEGIASTASKVLEMSIRIQHATYSGVVEVLHYDGTNERSIYRARVGASGGIKGGEVVRFDERKGWDVVTAVGSRNRGKRSFATPTVGVRHGVALREDVTNANATANRLVQVDDLGFPVTEGHRYWFRAVLHYTAAATTTGARFTIYGPGGATLRYREGRSLTTTTSTVTEGHAAYELPAASNATSAATGSNMSIIEGFIDTPPRSGFVNICFASEVAASAIVLKAGSFVHFMRVT